MARGSVFAPVAVLAAVLLPAAATPAAAQGQTAFPRFEVGGGGGVAGAVSLGDRDANLLTNDTAGSPFRLFTTATRLRPAAVVEARLGYRVTPRLTAEGRLTVGWPSLRVSISADAENAAPVEATSAVTEYLVEGGGAWRFASNARRWTPFVSGGAGVARHVHEGRALAETAVSGYAGAGTVYALGSTGAPPASRRSGLRFDVRLHLMHGGIAEGAGLASRVAATASLFVAF
jgi:hypothetical protein